ncbi:hypothetical protein NQ837_003644 [Providencia rettgeri]|uniref:Flagellar FliJ protein n=2 Tax=Providencia TaxID=586 RepID=A0AA42K0R4_9GAMM|nr:MULTISPECIES: hypothetical protein [Providencia]APC09821.1 hypothetical protein RB151_001050 [Providencia rettgeri]EIU7557791.1 hypothetical protein [Providencia rettgeri]EJD6082730.1 hypothetical protein [Providencia rettgeri]EJD6401716.1 hypothetical protein [Providencia rettgeri]EJD6411800.1 hypothetical protein [Providencia rettgeri]
MQNYQTTLTALFALKKRRETRLRSILTQLNQQISEQIQVNESLMKLREELCEQWKHYGSHEQLLTPSAIREYRTTLTNYYLQDQAILQKSSMAKRIYSELQIEKEQQLSLLQENIIEQEKLKLLME